MLMEEPTRATLEAWREVAKEYRGRLRPNRKTGEEVVACLKGNYPVREVGDAEALRIVADSVLENEPFSARLPAGAQPSPAAFIVENAAAGEALYAAQDEVFLGLDIFVGVDLASGYFFVEGSSLLWDELYAFCGLDEADLQNDYCVAEYVACLKRFGLLEAALH